VARQRRPVPECPQRPLHVSPHQTIATDQAHAGRAPKGDGDALAVYCGPAHSLVWCRGRDQPASAAQFQLRERIGGANCQGSGGGQATGTLIRRDDSCGGRRVVLLDLPSASGAWPGVRPGGHPNGAGAPFRCPASSSPRWKITLLGRPRTGRLLLALLPGSRCCPACPGHAEVTAWSGFDLGVYGCAARDSNPEPAD
jgi:hypothetical protein